jgi:hypothetical protein
MAITDDLRGAAESYVMGSRSGMRESNVIDLTRVNSSKDGTPRERVRYETCMWDKCERRTPPVCGRCNFYIVGDKK